MSREHIVSQGECLASIAARYGTSVTTLWDDPQNGELRERRQSPHLLAPGDIVRVPDVPPSGSTVSAGGSHRFHAQPARVTLRLKLLDPKLPDDAVAGSETEDPDLAPLPDPEPLAGCPYRLVVGRQIIDGVTDGDGLVEAEVPARATIAVLILEPDGERERRLTLRIGHLDPLDEPSGALQRLKNLGWQVEPEKEQEAIASFQAARGLEPSGALDDATKDALREASGC